MDLFCKDCYEEGKKMDRLIIASEEQLRAAINMLKIIQQDYERFSHEILRLYH